MRRALRRAAIQRAEARQFDRGENLLDRLPTGIWDQRTSRARELWNTARQGAAAGRAATQVLTQLVGLLHAADPQHGWTISTVSYRAMEDGACTAEERNQVIDFCQRWTRGAEKPHRLT